VIGHGHGGKLQLLGPIGKRVHLTGSIEQRILGVNMQMDEFSVHF
jgi:hypothetical protein